MARPPKYKTAEERHAAQRAQKNRSDQIRRRRAVGLPDEAPLMATISGERGSKAKLTSAQAKEVRRLRKREGWTLTTLARKFNVSERAISAILRGKSHKP